MACEDLLTNYNNQVALQATRNAELAESLAETQQRQFAAMAQQAAVAMAGMMYLNCLNGPGGFPGMLRQGQNLLVSLGKLQDEISELQQLSSGKK